jgi:hypothetical protein
MAKRKDEEQQAPPAEGLPQDQPAADAPRGDQQLLGGGNPGRTDSPAADSPAAAEQAEIAALQAEWRERGPQAGDPDEAAAAQTEEMAGRLGEARQARQEQAERRSGEERRAREQGAEEESDALGRLFAEAHRRGYDLVARRGPIAGAAAPARAPGVPDDDTTRALQEAAAAQEPGKEPLPAEGAGTYLVTYGAEPPVAVEADGPEQAQQLARERLGVRSSESPPMVRRLK